MTAEQFAEVVSRVESDGRVWPDLGDDERAFSTYQCHIDWLFDWAGRLRVYPLAGEKVNAFVRRVIIEFYKHETVVCMRSDVAAIMHYHKGHVTDPSKPDWDLAYAERFNERVRVLGY